MNELIDFDFEVDVDVEFEYIISGGGGGDDDGSDRGYSKISWTIYLDESTKEI